MRVLLTGAAGFIGSHVARALTDAGYKVIAVDALLEPVYATMGPPEGVTPVDIRDPDALAPLLRGVDVVVHLAAALPPGSLEPNALGGAAIRVSRPPAVEAVRGGFAVDHEITDRYRIAGQSPTGQQPRTGVQPPPGEHPRTAARPRRAEQPRFTGQPPTAQQPRVAGQPRTGERPRTVEQSESTAEGRSPAQLEAIAAHRELAAQRRASGSSRSNTAYKARPGEPTMREAPIFAAHNDFGTAVLLAAMEQAGVRRLVLGSSVSVYGEGRYRGLRSGPFFPGVRLRGDLDRGMFDHRAPRTGEILTWETVGEDTPLRPRTAYAASKVAQENYAMAWGATTGGGVTVLRYHHVYGDPTDENLALTAHSGIAARFRAELAVGRAPFVFEDGGQVRDFVHVRDVAAATAAVVRRPLSGFVPLNIASGHPITLWEVASIMSRACGGPGPVVSGQYRITDARHIAADPERARHTVDFTAAIPPTQGLADYAMSHRPAPRSGGFAAVEGNPSTTTDQLPRPR
jgi:dTDP-L-rhamnose 4-epimerase